jgi:hypothetical protein
LKTHVELKIRLKFKPGQTLHSVLRDFAHHAPAWTFPAGKSRDYQRHHGSEAGFVVCRSILGLPKAAVAIANLNLCHPNSFGVPNIIPKPQSQLSLTEYNSVGRAFATAFGYFIRRRKLGDLSVIGPDIGLEHIIRAPRCRFFFQSWLQTPTPVSHPSDVWQLDRFTCTVFRQHAKINLWELERYLVVDRRWKSSDASWAIRRIQTGLDILRLNQKF